MSSMLQIILLTILYTGVMYFVTGRMYAKRGIELSRLSLLIRTGIAGAAFFVIMYILGGL